MEKSGPPVGNEMYSRRGDAGPKPLMNSNAGYGAQNTGYGAPANNSYSNMNTGGYGGKF